MRPQWAIALIASILILGFFVPIKDVYADTFPISLIDENGFLWDIFDRCILSGTDAYDCAFKLIIGELIEDIEDKEIIFSSFTLEDGGREVVTNTEINNSLDVNRKIFVPEDDAFARFLEILNNPTVDDISTTLIIRSDLDSDPDHTNIIDTSSGDQIISTADDFIITDDDLDGAGDPTLVHAISCSGATVEPKSVFLGGEGDELIYTYDVTVPAGERVIIMHFASQNENQATAAISAQTLLNLGGSTLSGLSDKEKDDIVNYDCSFATPQEALEEACNDIDDDINPAEDSAVKDKLEDALQSCQTALTELNKTPPDNQSAAANIVGSIGTLEDAGKKGFDLETQRIDQLLDVSQALAVNAIDVANNTPGSDASKIASANVALANADNLRKLATSFGDFKDAATEYTVAIADAEGALP